MASAAALAAQAAAGAGPPPASAPVLSADTPAWVPPWMAAAGAGPAAPAPAAPAPAAPAPAAPAPAAAAAAAGAVQVVPYPQPTDNVAFNNRDCGQVMARPDWADQIDVILKKVKEEVPERVAGPNGRIWEPLDTDLLFHTLPSTDRDALHIGDVAFGQYFRGSQPDGAKMYTAPAGVNIYDVPSRFLARSSSGEDARLTENNAANAYANTETHYWSTCSASHTNLAARINYYLHRCEPYKAVLQLISCLEAREREQDGFRPTLHLADQAARTQFAKHTSTINTLYRLLFLLKSELTRTPPSAVNVNYFHAGGHHQFNVTVDPALAERIAKYASDMGAASAAAPPGTSKRKKKTGSASDVDNSWMNEEGGRRRTRRKNGRRRTQKKRKTYV